MPKNDIYLRSLTGAIFVTIVVCATIFSFQSLFTLTIVISSICLIEFLKMQNSATLLTNLFVHTTNFLILFSASGLYTPIIAYTTPIVIGLFLLFFTINLFRKGLSILDTLQNPIFSISYITIPFLCFILFSKGDGIEYNWQRPLLIFILVWSSDTFAYLSGRMIGKTALYPSLSPKKTVEGWIGGTILAAVAGGVMAYFWPFVGLMNGIVLGILVSIFGTTGDLFESAVKRNAGVKDSGKIIPGHGGLLDRFDAFLFAAVVVYAWYSLSSIK
jgi:phosphatidate cytidylyltransferase